MPPEMWEATLRDSGIFSPGYVDVAIRRQRGARWEVRGLPWDFTKSQVEAFIRAHGLQGVVERRSFPKRQRGERGRRGHR